MLDNFNGGMPGNYIGLEMFNNSIECNLLCDYGIELGPHPWYMSANIYGGTVTQNAISGAGVNINIEGAGTSSAPITVFGNQMSGAPAQNAFLCGARPGSNFNIGPDNNVVNLNGDPTPYSTTSYQGCA